MGNFLSRENEIPTASPLTQENQKYSGPDLNTIIHGGIPKLMQVSGDLHRMADYMMHLRNILIGVIVLSTIAVLFFLYSYLKINNKRLFGCRRSYNLYKNHKPSISTNESGLLSQQAFPKRTAEWIKNQNHYQTPVKVTIEDCSYAHSDT